MNQDGKERKDTQQFAKISEGGREEKKITKDYKRDILTCIQVIAMMHNNATLMKM